MNEKICLICLENIDDIEKVIEYNHCGIYYIHNECLNSWNHNECIICRKKFTDIVNNEIINTNLNRVTSNTIPLETISNLNTINSVNNVINITNESVSSNSSVGIIDVMSNPHTHSSNKCRTITCSMLIMFNLLFIGSYLLLRISDDENVQ